MLRAIKQKLKPSLLQQTEALSWRCMIRGILNYCLRDRIDSYLQGFAHGPFCNLKSKAEATPLTCSVNRSASIGEPWKLTRTAIRGKRKGEILPPSKRSPYEMHSSYLTEMKKSRPWYQRVNADVLQQALRNQNTAFQNFFSGKAKFPRFKKRTDVNSLQFAVKSVKYNEDKGKVYLPGLGWMGYFKSRTIGDGVVKTSWLKFEADGLYLVSLLDYPGIHEYSKPDSELRTVNGLDRGVNKIVAGADGDITENPRITKKYERRLRIRQARLSRKKKGSKNRAKAGKRVARVHQKIKRVRDDFQWKLAQKEAAKADVIGLEDLNIKGMTKRCKPKKNEDGKFIRNGQAAKSALSKAILDAAWYALELKIIHQVKKLGGRVEKVRAAFSSLECSACGHTSKNNRPSQEKFICEQCGHHDDADVDAGVVIAQRVIEKLGNKNLTVVSRKVTPNRESTRPRKRDISLTVVDEPGNLDCNEETFNPVQLDIFRLNVDLKCGRTSQESPVIAPCA